MNNNLTELSRYKDQHNEVYAQSLIMRLFGRLISAEEFDLEVEKLWQDNHFLLHTPMLAQTINQMVKPLDQSYNSTYGADVENVDFFSKWLVNDFGLPGAIYIDAPPEPRVDEKLLIGLNRDIHCHDSARGALILEGNPIFHFRRTHNNHVTQYMLPVEPGDLILWPKDTHHTFNAMNGFSLLSIIGSYIEPDNDGFSYQIEDNQAILERQSVQKLRVIAKV